jgi:Domain of unknown function (DUF4387)
MRLGDVAALVRSKNAGPFTLTFDVIFDDPDAFDRVTGAGIIDPAWVARTYGVAERDVQVHAYRPGLAIKVTVPRDVPAGSRGDRDVFGAQQSAPLIELELPWEDR